MNLLRYIENLWRRWRGKSTATVVQQAKPSVTTASAIAQLRAQVNSQLDAQPADKGYVYVNIAGIAPSSELGAFADEVRRKLKGRIFQIVVNTGGGMTVVQIKWPVSESFAGVHSTTAA